ncbi:MAG: transposase [Nannocystaceae bacterium]
MSVVYGSKNVRRRLERLCRYMLRPPFAQDAVKALPDGQVRIYFKQPTRQGATFTDISTDTFLARLAALVPPPRFHLVRCYVLANRQSVTRQCRWTLKTNRYDRSFVVDFDLLRKL